MPFKGRLASVRAPRIPCANNANLHFYHTVFLIIFARRALLARLYISSVIIWKRGKRVKRKEASIRKKLYFYCTFYPVY